MSNYRRKRVPGGTYFFTVNLADRRKRWLVEHIDKLREAYADAQRARPFETLAIVILPDHLHCIWRLPAYDADFSNRWAHIKGGFSRRLEHLEYISPKRQRRGERGIWQRRFWEHLICDDYDLRRHIEYIHSNPVKHGHVDQVSDWPYSSWRA
jgi:putative transposase